MEHKHRPGIRFTALVVAFVFTLTSVTWNSTASAAPADTTPTPAFLPIENLTIPAEIGTITKDTLGARTTSHVPRSEARGPGPVDRFVILIQDAHAVIDAQENIRKILSHLRTQYGLRLAALEGAKGRLEPILLRTFPEPSVKRKVLAGYENRAELSGPEMESVFQEIPGEFFGIEDWPLYEKNYTAYLAVQEKKPELLRQWNSLKQTLDAERAAVYDPKLNEFQDAWEGYVSERSSLLDLLIYLSEFSGLFKTLPGYQELPGLITSIGYEKSGKQSALEPLVRKIADEFKTKYLRGLGVKTEMNFYNRYQAFMTGQISAGQMLQYLVQLGAETGKKPKLTPALKLLLGHTQTLSEIKGSRLYDELRRFLPEVQASLLKTPAQRELAEKYQKLFLLKDMIELELTHEDLAQYQKEPDAYFALTGDAAFKNDLAPALAFYRAALDRDQAFYKNIESLLTNEMLQTPNSELRTVVVVAGGFHTNGIERILKEKGIAYAVVTPKIASLAGHENYFKVMRGDVSFKEFLKTTYFDALMRHSAKALTDALPIQDQARTLKTWRDNVIRDLAKDGRITEAGKYLPYIDELLQNRGEAVTVGPKRSKEEILGIVRKELEKFKKDSFERIWKTFEFQLGIFTDGLKELVAKKDLTTQTVTELLDRANHSKPSFLAKRVYLNLEGGGGLIISPTQMRPDLTPSVTSLTFGGEGVVAQPSPRVITDGMPLATPEQILDVLIQKARSPEPIIDPAAQELITHTAHDLASHGLMSRGMLQTSEEVVKTPDAQVSTAVGSMLDELAVLAGPKQTPQSIAAHLLQIMEKQPGMEAATPDILPPVDNGNLRGLPSETPNPISKVVKSNGTPAFVETPATTSALSSQPAAPLESRSEMRSFDPEAEKREELQALAARLLDQFYGQNPDLTHPDDAAWWRSTLTMLEEMKKNPNEEQLETLMSDIALNPWANQGRMKMPIFAAARDDVDRFYVLLDELYPGIQEAYAKATNFLPDGWMRQNWDAQDFIRDATQKINDQLKLKRETRNSKESAFEIHQQTKRLLMEMPQPFPKIIEECLQPPEPIKGDYRNGFVISLVNMDKADRQTYDVFSYQPDEKGKFTLQFNKSDLVLFLFNNPEFFSRSELRAETRVETQPASPSETPPTPGPRPGSLEGGAVESRAETRAPETQPARSESRSAESELTSFQKGDSVWHKNMPWGTGKVVTIVPPNVVVEFPQIGRKILRAQFLTKINEATVTDQALRVFIRNLDDSTLEQVQSNENGLNRLSDLAPFAHGFGEGGPRKIVSSILFQKIQHLSDAEAQEMGLRIRFMASWEPGRVWFETLLGGKTVGDVNYGPDYAILSPDIPNLKTLEPKIEDLPTRYTVTHVPIDQVLFFVVSNQAKKDFIKRSLQEAVSLNLISKEFMNFLPPVYTDNEVLNLSEKNFSKLLRTKTQPVALSGGRSKLRAETPTTGVQPEANRSEMRNQPKIAGLEPDLKEGEKVYYKSVKQWGIIESLDKPHDKVSVRFGAGEEGLKTLKMSLVISKRLLIPLKYRQGWLKLEGLLEDDVIILENSGIARVKNIDVENNKLTIEPLGPQGIVAYGERLRRGNITISFFDEARMALWNRGPKSKEAAILAEENAKGIYTHSLVPLFFGFDVFYRRVKNDAPDARQAERYLEILNEICQADENYKRLVPDKFREDPVNALAYYTSTNINNYGREVLIKLFIKIFQETGEDLVLTSVLESFERQRKGERVWPTPHAGTTSSVWPDIKAVRYDVDYYYRHWLLREGLRTVHTAAELEELSTPILSAAVYYPKERSAQQHSRDWFSKMILEAKTDPARAKEVVDGLAAVLSSIFSEDILTDIDAVVIVPSQIGTVNQMIPLGSALTDFLRYDGQYPIEFLPGALKKVKETGKQKEQGGPEARQLNIQGAFAGNPDVGLTGKTVLIADDIVTSGATLKEAKRAAYAAGAKKVILFAFGKTYFDATSDETLSTTRSESRAAAFGLRNFMAGAMVAGILNLAPVDVSAGTKPLSEEQKAVLRAGGLNSGILWPVIQRQGILKGVTQKNLEDSIRFSEDQVTAVRDAVDWLIANKILPEDARRAKVLFLSNISSEILKTMNSGPENFAMALLGLDIVIVHQEAYKDVPPKERTIWLAVRIAHEIQHLLLGKEVPVLVQEAKTYEVTYKVFEAANKEAREKGQPPVMSDEELAAQRRVWQAFKVLAENPGNVVTGAFEGLSPESLGQLNYSAVELDQNMVRILVYKMGVLRAEAIQSVMFGVDQDGKLFELRQAEDPMALQNRVIEILTQNRDAVGKILGMKVEEGLKGLNIGKAAIRDDDPNVAKIQIQTTGGKWTYLEVDLSSGAVRKASAARSEARAAGLDRDVEYQMRQMEREELKRNHGPAIEYLVAPNSLPVAFFEAAVRKLRYQYEVNNPSFKGDIRELLNRFSRSEARSSESENERWRKAIEDARWEQALQDAAGKKNGDEIIAILKLATSEVGSMPLPGRRALLEILERWLGVLTAVELTASAQDKRFDSADLTAFESQLALVREKVGISEAVTHVQEFVVANQQELDAMIESYEGELFYDHLEQEMGQLTKPQRAEMTFNAALSYAKTVKDVEIVLKAIAPSGEAVPEGTAELIYHAFQEAEREAPHVFDISISAFLRDHKIPRDQEAACFAALLAAVKYFATAAGMTYQNFLSTMSRPDRSAQHQLPSSDNRRSEVRGQIYDRLRNALPNISNGARRVLRALETVPLSLIWVLSIGITALSTIAYSRNWISSRTHTVFLMASLSVLGVFHALIDWVGLIVGTGTSAKSDPFAEEIRNMTDGELAALTQRMTDQLRVKHGDPVAQFMASVKVPLKTRYYAASLLSRAKDKFDLRGAQLVLRLLISPYVTDESIRLISKFMSYPGMLTVVKRAQGDGTNINGAIGELAAVESLLGDKTLPYEVSLQSLSETVFDTEGRAILETDAVLIDPVRRLRGRIEVKNRFFPGETMFQEVYTFIVQLKKEIGSKIQRIKKLRENLYFNGVVSIPDSYNEYADDLIVAIPQYIKEIPGSEEMIQRFVGRLNAGLARLDLKIKIRISYFSRDKLYDPDLESGIQHPARPIAKGARGTWSVDDFEKIQSWQMNIELAASQVVRENEQAKEKFETQVTRDLKDWIKQRNEKGADNTRNAFLQYPKRHIIEYLWSIFQEHPTLPLKAWESLLKRVSPERLEQIFRELDLRTYPKSRLDSFPELRCPFEGDLHESIDSDEVSPAARSEVRAVQRHLNFVKPTLREVMMEISMMTAGQSPFRLQGERLWYVMLPFWWVTTQYMILGMPLGFTPAVWMFVVGFMYSTYLFFYHFSRISGWSKELFIQPVRQNLSVEPVTAPESRHVRSEVRGDAIAIDNIPGEEIDENLRTLFESIETYRADLFVVGSLVRNLVLKHVLKDDPSPEVQNFLQGLDYHDVDLGMKNLVMADLDVFDKLHRLDVVGNWGKTFQFVDLNSIRTLFNMHPQIALSGFRLEKIPNQNKYRIYFFGSEADSDKAIQTIKKRSITMVGAEQALHDLEAGIKPEARVLSDRLYRILPLWAVFKNSNVFTIDPAVDRYISLLVKAYVEENLSLAERRLLISYVVEKIRPVLKQSQPAGNAEQTLENAFLKANLDAIAQQAFDLTFIKARSEARMKSDLNRSGTSQSFEIQFLASPMARWYLDHYSQKLSMRDINSFGWFPPGELFPRDASGARRMLSRTEIVKVLQTVFDEIKTRAKSEDILEYEKNISDFSKGDVFAFDLAHHLNWLVLHMPLAREKVERQYKDSRVIAVARDGMIYPISEFYDREKFYRENPSAVFWGGQFIYRFDKSGKELPRKGMLALQDAMLDRLGKLAGKVLSGDIREAQRESVTNSFIAQMLSQKEKYQAFFDWIEPQIRDLKIKNGSKLIVYDSFGSGKSAMGVAAAIKYFYPDSSVQVLLSHSKSSGAEAVSDFPSIAADNKIRGWVWPADPGVFFKYEGETRDHRPFFKLDDINAYLAEVLRVLISYNQSVFGETSEGKRILLHFAKSEQKPVPHQEMTRYLIPSEAIAGTMKISLTRAETRMPETPSTSSGRAQPARSEVRGEEPLMLANGLPLPVVVMVINSAAIEARTAAEDEREKLLKEARDMFYDILMEVYHALAETQDYSRAKAIIEKGVDPIVEASIRTPFEADIRYYERLIYDHDKRAALEDLWSQPEGIQSYMNLISNKGTNFKSAMAYVERVYPVRKEEAKNKQGMMTARMLVQAAAFFTQYSNTISSVKALPGFFELLRKLQTGLEVWHAGLSESDQNKLEIEKPQWNRIRSFLEAVLNAYDEHPEAFENAETLSSAEPVTAEDIPLDQIREALASVTQKLAGKRSEVRAEDEEHLQRIVSEFLIAPVFQLNEFLGDREAVSFYYDRLMLSVRNYYAEWMKEENWKKPFRQRGEYLEEALGRINYFYSLTFRQFVKDVTGKSAAAEADIEKLLGPATRMAVGVIKQFDRGKVPSRMIEVSRGQIFLYRLARFSSYVLISSAVVEILDFLWLATGIASLGLAGAVFGAAYYVTKRLISRSVTRTFDPLVSMGVPNPWRDAAFQFIRPELEWEEFKNEGFDYQSVENTNDADAPIVKTITVHHPSGRQLPANLGPYNARLLVFPPEKDAERPGLVVVQYFYADFPARLSGARIDRFQANVALLKEILKPYGGYNVVTLKSEGGDAFSILEALSDYDPVSINRWMEDEKDKKRLEEMLAGLRSSDAWDFGIANVIENEGTALGTVPRSEARAFTINMHGVKKGLPLGSRHGFPLLAEDEPLYKKLKELLGDVYQNHPNFYFILKKLPNPNIRFLIFNRILKTAETNGDDRILFGSTDTSSPGTDLKVVSTLISADREAPIFVLFPLRANGSAIDYQQEAPPPVSVPWRRFTLIERLLAHEMAEWCFDKEQHFLIPLNQEKFKRYLIDTVGFQESVLNPIPPSQWPIATSQGIHRFRIEGLDLPDDIPYQKFDEVQKKRFHSQFPTWYSAISPLDFLKECMALYFLDPQGFSKADPQMAGFIEAMTDWNETKSVVRSEARSSEDSPLPPEAQRYPELQEPAKDLVKRLLAAGHTPMVTVSEPTAQYPKMPVSIDITITYSEVTPGTTKSAIPKTAGWSLSFMGALVSCAFFRVKESEGEELKFYEEPDLQTGTPKELIDDVISPNLQKPPGVNLDLRTIFAQRSEARVKKEVPEDRAKAFKNPFTALHDHELRALIRDVLIHNYNLLTGSFTAAALPPDIVRMKIPQEKKIEILIDRILDTAATFKGNHIEAAKYIKANIIDFGEGSAFEKAMQQNSQKIFGDYRNAEMRYVDRYYDGPILADIGVGGGHFLAGLVGRSPPGKFKKLIGTDVMRERIEKQIATDPFFQHLVANGEFKFYHQTGENVPTDAIGRATVNTAVLQFVLHHVYHQFTNPNDPQAREKLVEYMRSVYDLLAPGGRVVIYEDSYPAKSLPEYDPAESLRPYLQPQFTQRFLAMNPVQQYQYYVWNEWFWSLFVLGVYDMVMPFRYYTMEQWMSVFKEAGFKVIESQYWGFRLSSHGGNNAFFVLEKPGRSEVRGNPVEALKDPALRDFIGIMLKTRYVGSGLGQGLADAILENLSQSNGDRQVLYRDVIRFKTDKAWNDAYARYKAEKKYADTDQQIEPFLAELKAGAEILDVGAGGNDFARVIVAEHPEFNVTGTDPYVYENPFAKGTTNPKFIAQVDAEGKPTPFNLPIATGSMDVVTMNAALHHVSPEDMPRFIEEIKRVLKPGGKLVLIEDTYSLAMEPDPKISDPLLTAAFLDKIKELKEAGADFARRFFAFNDWYANIVVHEWDGMSMPYNFHSMEEWTEILAPLGLIPAVSASGQNELRNIGFPQGGFHKPSIGVMAFTPSSGSVQRSEARAGRPDLGKFKTAWNAAENGNWVLVVDNSKGFRDAIVRVITGEKKLGLPVITAANGEAALKILLERLQAGEGRPILMTDFNMPAMNGGELVDYLAEVATADAPLRVIMMSMSPENWSSFPAKLKPKGNNVFEIIGKQEMSRNPKLLISALEKWKALRTVPRSEIRSGQEVLALFREMERNPQEKFDEVRLFENPLIGLTGMSDAQLAQVVLDILRKEPANIGAVQARLMELGRAGLERERATVGDQALKNLMALDADLLAKVVSSNDELRPHLLGLERYGNADSLAGNIAVSFLLGGVESGFADIRGAGSRGLNIQAVKKFTLNIFDKIRNMPGPAVPMIVNNGQDAGFVLKALRHIEVPSLVVLYDDQHPMGRGWNDISRVVRSYKYGERKSANALVGDVVSAGDGETYMVFLTLPLGVEQHGTLSLLADFSTAANDELKDLVCASVVLINRIFASAPPMEQELMKVYPGMLIRKLKEQGIDLMALSPKNGILVMNMEELAQEFAAQQDVGKAA